MQALLQHSWLENVTAIYCSTEQKAIDGAEILASHLGIDYEVHADLGENDRSATGYLEPAEFERTADRFFAEPKNSVRGWETAQSAQARIVDALQNIDRLDESSGDIAIVSHGAVGTLLYCTARAIPIDRRWDQPGQGGGNYMTLRFSPTVACTWWESID